MNGADEEQEVTREAESHQFVVPFAYPIVDGALAHFCAFLTTSYTYRRKEISSGSCSYHISTSIPGRRQHRFDIFVIVLRIVGNELTCIEWQPSEHFPDGASRSMMADALIRLHLAFSQLLERERKEFQELAASQPTMPTDPNAWMMAVANIRTFILKSPENAPGRTGRPASADYDWAQQQIEAGRERKEVFAEYLQRTGIDPRDKEAVQEKREHFRQALNRRNVRK